MTNDAKYLVDLKAKAEFYARARKRVLYCDADIDDFGSYVVERALRCKLSPMRYMFIDFIRQQYGKAGQKGFAQVSNDYQGLYKDERQPFFLNRELEKEAKRKERDRARAEKKRLEELTAELGLKSLREVMDDHIVLVLEATGGNRTHAAHILQMTVRALRNHIARINSNRQISL